MFCESCGAALKDGAKFCGSCGAKVESSATAASSSVVNSIRLAALPLGLANCEININSVTAEGPDSDGDLSISITYEVTNKSDEDWEHLSVRTQLLNAAGQIVEDTQDTHEQSFDAGETEELQVSFYGVKAKFLGENSEKAHVIINAVASTLIHQKLGQVDIPANAFEVTALKPTKLGESVQLISGSLWKTEPDDDKDSRVEVKALFQNLTDKNLPLVKITAEINDKKGNEVADAGGSDEVRPGSIVTVSGSGYTKDKKLIGAKADLAVLVYTPVAAGVSQRSGIKVDSIDEHGVKDSERISDFQVLMERVTEDGCDLRYGDRDLKANLKIIFPAVTSAGRALQYADLSSAAKVEKEKVVLAAINASGTALEFVDDTLRADKKIVLAAVNSDGIALAFADELFKSDREVVMAAVSNAGCALASADPSLRANREVVLAAINSDGNALAFADESLRADREVVLAAVNHDGNSLDFADELLKADREVVMAAVTRDGNALRFAQNFLKADREVVMAAVASYGNALEFAHDSLKADRNIVEKAVNQQWDALEFAGDDLKSDREIVLAAVRSYGGAFQYAADELKGDKGFVIQAVNIDSSAMEYAEESLQRDPEVVSSQRKGDSNVLGYV
jgi:hypothetical protein